MAKIGLVVKNLSQESLSLAKALSANQNEVYFITETDARLPENLDFPVQTPFRKWSLIESLRLFPRLATEMPDILHFVFTHPSEIPTRADWLLANLIQPFPRKAVVASFFYSPEEVQSFWLKPFLAACHGVSWGSHIYLLQARRAGLQSDKTPTEVIRPFWSPEENISETLQSLKNEELSQFLQRIKPYLLIPGTHREFFESARESELFFDQTLNLLFLDQRPSGQSFKSQYFLPNLSQHEIRFCVEKSEATLMAFNTLTLSDLQKFWIWSQTLKRPLLVSPLQNEIFPGLVSPGRSGWVLDRGEESLRTLARDKFRLQKNSASSGFAQFPLFDSASNQLTRLFTSALALRS